MKVLPLAYCILITITCLHCAQAPPPTSAVELFDLDQLEQAVHQLVNTERSQRRLNPLRWNVRLSQIARAHSADMLENNYFSHDSPDGRTPAHRANDAGFECTIVKKGSQRIGIGENILTTFYYHSYEFTESKGTEDIKYNWKTPEELAQEIVSTWMNSSGHRRNLLSPDYIQEGLGVVVGAEQKIYITQNFC